MDNETLSWLKIQRKENKFVTFENLNVNSAKIILNDVAPAF